ncbi:uncharacterized protein RAG0_06610 [Rhynchosporium agropyri]|uniref:Uncharacterized protein n=1 Tax=Rhynchosporium agropyri TaxID=914238 RepID=A0A1E1KI10_9HELO|nr:uncharacterized protein RAG0_06610 [Rhynchosporium agropyri]
MKKKNNVIHKAPKEFMAVRVVKPKAPKAPIYQSQPAWVPQLLLPAPVTAPCPSAAPAFITGPALASPTLVPSPYQIFPETSSKYQAGPLKPLLELGHMYTSYAPSAKILAQAGNFRPAG